MSVGRKLPALDTATRLVEPFLSAVRRAVAGHPRVVVLYSGGLDSTLLAECLRDVRPTLFSVGVPGASDLAAASTGASGLGLHHAMCEVIVHDVEMAIERFGSDIETLREPYRSVAVAEAISLLRAPPGLLVTGQGADELFHGYAHFRGLSLADRLSRASADLERLTEHEWPRFQRMSAGAGRQIVAPYLDDEFVRAVQREASSIAVASEGEPKRTLRELARHLGVPAELAARPKKAMQYGSGIGRLVREFDRSAAGTRGG